MVLRMSSKLLILSTETFFIPFCFILAFIKIPKSMKIKEMFEFTDNSLEYVSQDHPYNLCHLSFVRYFLVISAGFKGHGSCSCD